MNKPKKALLWILNILQKHNCPYQISGGFAANIYGSNRPLADIDIEIPHEKFHKIIKEIEPFILQGPNHFKDENWDLYFAKIEYEGQKIDLCDGNLKITSHKTGEIVLNGVDFSKAVPKEIFGIEVQVIPKELLITYKEALGRDVDIEDIKQIT